MKCVRSGDKMERLPDDLAGVRVEAGWAYCKKAEWKKAQGKGKGKAEEVSAVSVEPAEPVLDKKARWEKAKRDKAKAEVEAVLG